MCLNIAVVGDSMVDEYYSVTIKGISPEFPIIAMHSSDATPRVFPGGAANVAHQFLHFKNVNSYLVSFIDNYFKSSFSSLINLDYSKLIESSIPLKRRFYSDGFPTYRWDIEKENYGLGHQINSYCLDLHNNFFSKLHNNFDAIIFSDYCKGVFFPNNFYYIPKNVLTVVDSKSKDIDKWFGCTVFKPNLKEAIQISGKNNAVDAGLWIRSRIKCEFVVITNADKGITIVSSDGAYEVNPTSKGEAVSVIGAGDCFTAILTLSLLEGFNINDSSLRAWDASSAYVLKKYNSPISPLDLLGGKLISDPSILSKRDFKLVFTNGCFDLMHDGHINNLKFAKSKGDKLVVALNTDDSIRRLKPNRPIQTLQERINILSSLEFVDYVVYFSEDTPLNIIDNIKPDVLVKGDEYDFNQIVGCDIVPEVVTFPMVKGLSTTSLLRKIQENRL